MSLCYFPFLFILKSYPHALHLAPPTCSPSSSTHVPIIFSQIADFFIIVIDRWTNIQIEPAESIFIFHTYMISVMPIDM